MCMSLYSETLECAISLERILSATAGRATHGDTHTHPRSPRGEGQQQVPALRLPLVAGWLPPCGESLFGGQHCPQIPTPSAHMEAQNQASPLRREQR